VALAVIRLNYFILSMLIAFLSDFGIVCLLLYIVSAVNIQMFKKLLKQVYFSYAMFENT